MALLLTMLLAGGTFRSGGVAARARRLRRCAAASNPPLQLFEFRLEIFVRHDQRLDGGAQIAVAHRDRLVAGLLVMAGLRQCRGLGHGVFPGCLEAAIMFPFCSKGVKPDAGFSRPDCWRACLGVSAV